MKLENLQVTGDFKPRGSLNKLFKLKPEISVIASTVGNHGIGAAFAEGNFRFTMESIFAMILSVS